MGVVFTFLINWQMTEDKISLTSLGDGVALGLTNSQVMGKSFNDYLKDDLENRHKLKEYNNEFAIEQLDLEKLNDYLEDNELGKKTKIPLKQIIAKADILTIAIGMDEIMDYQIKNKLNDKRIDDYLNNYQTLIKNIRTFYDKNIVIISLYPAFTIDKNVIYKINKELEILAVENKCKFLDISAIALKKDNYLDNASYYMNYKGHKEIYNHIRKIIKI